eukprot:TRINITY_DN27954_c0_g1_i1.p1 TRINITY_DN27954_c0_g1~~TRINITY_DN27954_c0_g1_i1.p1  ORF type:complete len:171 (-),score=15.56 TRINITY_DN27954_c0_g1_i1:18-530(-)
MDRDRKERQKERPLLELRMVAHPYPLFPIPPIQHPLVKIFASPLARLHRRSLQAAHQQQQQQSAAAVEASPSATPLPSPPTSLPSKPIDTANPTATGSLNRSGSASPPRSPPPDTSRSKKKSNEIFIYTDEENCMEERRAALPRYAFDPAKSSPASRGSQALSNRIRQFL